MVRHPFSSYRVSWRSYPPDEAMENAALRDLIRVKLQDGRLPEADRRHDHLHVWSILIRLQNPRWASSRAWDDAARPRRTAPLTYNVPKVVAPSHASATRGTWRLANEFSRRRCDPRYRGRTARILGRGFCGPHYWLGDRRGGARCGRQARWSKAPPGSRTDRPREPG